jgi:hypothetical protein
MNEIILKAINNRTCFNKIYLQFLAAAVLGILGNILPVVLEGVTVPLEDGVK